MSKGLLMKTVTNQHMKNVESRSSFNGTDVHYYQELTQYTIVMIYFIVLLVQA